MIDKGKAISKLELMRCNSEWNKDFNKALDVAIKVLRRTGSEDCISRQALIDEILEDGNGAVLFYTKGMDEDELVEHIEKQMIKHFVGVIEYAPPVTPTERTGEWIDKGWKGDWQFETDGRGNCWHEYECSECGFHNKGSKNNYCPNCGAKMKGGAENE